jgi:hypothetical protein
MDTKMDSTIEFQCNICNKYYSSYKSLWNHNKKFHNINSKSSVSQSKSTVSQSKSVVSLNIPNDKIYKCKYCNCEYKHKQSRWKHEQKCNITNLELNKIQEENKQKELLLQLAKEEKEILKLKLKLQKSTKVDNITLKKLNKLLMERNNFIKNSTINSNNNNKIQNNIVNNFQLIGFGKEEIIETLSNTDKKKIMNAKYCSLEKLIEIVHCGTYNQIKNIIITNMKDNFMYKYDDTKGQFLLSTKNEVLNSLINYRLEDLEVIYNDLLEKNKLDDKTKDIIENFINKINYSDSKFTDCDGKEHENYKQYKINEIKILLFNNQDKITNDISLLLIANEVTSETKFLD